MESPPAMGSSRSTGGILRGRAYGNNLNHADFPEITDIPPSVNQQVMFKVFAYLIYCDPVTVNVVPDSSLHHNVSFIVSTIPPLDCALVLKRLLIVLNLLNVSYNIFILPIAHYFKAAHIFTQSNISGTCLWNLLGPYPRVLGREEVLEYNSANECHILCVCILFLGSFND
jgi:hypothetical protein